MSTETNAAFRVGRTIPSFKEMISFVLKIGIIWFAFAIQNSCERSGQIVKNGGDTNTPKSETKMESEGLKNMPKLEANFVLQESSLRIEYKVKNSTDTPIYLFNRLWEFESSGKTKLAVPNAYSCFRDDATLYVAKQIPPLPKTKSVEIRLVPYVTKVEAGKEFVETIDLTVPVEENNPYFPKMPDSETEDRLAEAAVFGIEFIREIEGLKVTPAAIEGSLSVWHHDLFGNVESLETKRKSIGVKVKRRKDAFERF